MSLCLCVCLCVCVIVTVTIGAGVSGPAIGTDAAEACGVFHTGASVHTGGRQTRVFHCQPPTQHGQSRDAHTLASLNGPSKRLFNTETWSVPAPRGTTLLIVPPVAARVGRMRDFLL